MSRFKKIRSFTKCVFLFATFSLSIIIFFVSTKLIETKTRYLYWRSETSTEFLLVMVISNRDALESRRLIRQTWSNSHRNVRFMVGEHFCGYPPEQQMQGKCATNNRTVSVDHLQQYLKKEEHTTDQLRLEPNVVLLPVSDTYEQARKVNGCYAWALRNTDAKWILMVFDDSYVRIRLLEKYLRNNFDPEDNVIVVIGGTGDAVNVTENGHSIESASTEEKLTQTSLLSLGHIASRLAAKYAVSRGDFDPIPKIRAESQLTQSVHWKISENMTNVGNCSDISKLVITHTIPTNNMRACFYIDSVRSATKLTEQQRKTLNLNITTEYAGNFLHWQRFDVIIKMVYAFFYSTNKHVPDIFERAYTEHLRVWNKFLEYCSNIQPYWFDSVVPCQEKKKKTDFVSSFHNTITSIQKNGFRSDASQIPVDKGGIALNGAHRVAAATVLSKNATFQHVNTSYVEDWDYQFFQKLGLSKNLTDISMLEWMKIQLDLPRLTSKVFILSVFSTDQAKDKDMRKIVLEKCSSDKGILYEKIVTVNKLGMNQLITHMYGNQSWLGVKIDHILSLFKSSTFTVVFVFFFGKTLDKLTNCKHDIRTLYNYKNFKSSAHIPDSPEESLILAEMILNPNSVQFLNNARNGKDCKRIATEVARRSSLKPIPTLPGLFLGRDDLMIDSGSVLHLFNLRELTDVDILFLHEIDKRILGKKNDFRIEAHAFKSNSISSGRAWGEDHFTGAVKTKWDLFYDPANYGFCYGIKFVSPEQLVRYKLKRNEPQKDQHDVKLIRDMLNNTHIHK